jgi:CRP/FNR family transcriptional regulator, cyclic AMP receptor protein
VSGERIGSLPSGLKHQKSTFLETSKLLESTRWADTLSGKEVETFSKYLHVCTAEKDAVIVREGSREAYLCLLVAGKVSVVKAGDAGAPRQLGSIGPGQTFGEMSLIDGEPRSASVIAEDKSTLVVLTGEGFASLSLEVPRLGIKILLKISKLLSQRLRQTSGALVDQLAG